MYTLAAFTAIIAGVAAAPRNFAARGVSKGTYVSYNGDGSTGNGWPSEDKWVGKFDDMWSDNVGMITASCSPYNVPNTTPAEADQMKDAINQVAKDTGVDARVILAFIMQESKGCVRVWTTNYGVNNPGLMQDHNGPHNCNAGSQSAPGLVQTPCPQPEILGMIQDGTNGTPDGDGIKQVGGDSKNSEDIYKAARKYNSGSIAASGNLADGIATHSYSSDIANRLMGVVFDSSPFVQGPAGTGPAAPAAPAPADPAPAPAPAAPHPDAPAGGACDSKVTVASGDTCWAIANAHGITVDQLTAKNAGLSCQTLQIGQSVCV